MLLENEKINYNPLVLCNTLFNIVSYNTDIQGFWVDKGKLYIDNIELKKYEAINQGFFYYAKEKLFKQGEKCVFYKNAFNEGVIEYPNYKTIILKNRIAWIENKKPSQEYIKELLKINGGLTVYKIGIRKYLIEIYK